MSPKNKVPYLTDICVNHVSNILVHVLANGVGKDYYVVENYLLDATYGVIQELLKIILKTATLNASTRFDCLQVLLRSDVRKLDTGIFPESYYRKILNTLTAKCREIQHLNLKGVWVRRHPRLLSKFLLKLNKLRVLLIPHIPDDLVLETVKMCKNLSVLDISGDCAFTEDGIRQLKSTSLRVLHIGMFGKPDICKEENSAELVADLIMQLPNLNVLKIYSFAGNAILNIYKRHPNYKTKLAYIHDTSTTPETFNAIVNVCPQLEGLHFHTPGPNVVNRLGELKLLNSLKLSRPNCGELLHYLQTSGSKIQELKLNSIKGACFDVSEICLLAPHLVTLECFRLNLSCLHPRNCFRNLQFVDIMHSNLSSNVLGYLLINAPLLRRMLIRGAIQMTDSDVLKICVNSDLQCLEELWFSSAPYLTVTSAKLLMKHCPNLNVLGELSGWDVTADDMDHLRTVILNNNFDLNFLPVNALP